VTASIGKAAQFVAGQAGGSSRGGELPLHPRHHARRPLLHDPRRPHARAGPAPRAPFGPEQKRAPAVITSDLVSASVTATLAIAALQASSGASPSLSSHPHGRPVGHHDGDLRLLRSSGGARVGAGGHLAGPLGLAREGHRPRRCGCPRARNVDNLVRPLLLAGKSQMNTLVLIISLMGGVSAFGFIGIVLGPLVAALLTALVESYHAAPEAAPTPPRRLQPLLARQPLIPPRRRATPRRPPGGVSVGRSRIPFRGRDHPVVVVD